MIVFRMIVFAVNLTHNSRTAGAVWWISCPNVEPVTEKTMFPKSLVI